MIQFILKTKGNELMWMNLLSKIEIKVPVQQFNFINRSYFSFNFVPSAYILFETENNLLHKLKQ